MYETAVSLYANDVLNMPITGDEVQKAVSQLTTNETVGYDGVINEYIKSTVNKKVIFCQKQKRVSEKDILQTIMY